MVGGSTRGGDRNVTGGDRKTYERGYGFRRRGDRWLADRWNPLGGFSGGTAPPVVLNDGDPVTTWPDSSTNGNNATQTGAARPTFKTNIVNGKPVVRFTSAASSKMNLTTPISGAVPWTVFMVAQGTGDITGLGSNVGAAPSVGAPVVHGGAAYCFATSTGWNAGPLPIPATTWSVYTGSIGSIFQNGTSISSQGSFPGANAGNLDNIGNGYGFPSNGDIAEIIFYNGTVAIRTKVVLLLGVLVTTGQIPSTAEADALLAAGDLVALEAYLIEHGVPVEQARDTLEPMAVGDRANIEKYLGTKYGITVAGGTAVQPDTVAGLQGWWKADSLAAVTGPPPSSLLTGLVSYWKMEEASGTRVDSHGTNNLTPNGTPPPGPITGIQGQGVYINNYVANQFLSHASNASLQVAGNTDFTFAFWVYQGEVDSGLITKDDDAANSRDYTIDSFITSGQDFRFYIKGGASYLATVPIAAGGGYNKWIFLVAWYDSALGQLNLKMNDQILGQSPGGATGTDVSNAEFRIGAREYLGAEEYGNCGIDEVGFWKRKLTPAEMTQLYNRGVGNTYPLFNATHPFDPTDVAGLKGWWTAEAITAGSLLLAALKDRDKPEVMPAGVDPKAPPADGAALLTWVDSSTNANHLIGNYGFPKFYNNVINGKPVVRFGGDGPAFVLSVPLVTTSGWTILSVMKPRLATVELSTLNSSTDQGNGGPLSNGTNYYIGVNGVYFQGGTPDANWHVFSGDSSQKLYIDGALKSLTSVGGTPVTSPMDWIGRRVGVTYSDGDYAEIIAYQGVLSTTDRQNVENYLKTKYALTAPPPFDPTTIAGLKVWLKADAITTPGLILRRPDQQPGDVAEPKDEIEPRAISDGDLVNTWPDSSGSGNGVAATSGKQPTFKTNIVNGKPVLRFDGTSDFMRSAGDTGVTAPDTVFAVVNANVATQNFTILWSIAASQIFIIANPNGAFFINSGTGAGIADTANHSGAFHVFTAIFNGTSSSGYVDGSLVASGDAGTGVVGPVNIGSQNAAAPFALGDFAEILIYNSALSTTDRQNVEAYLKAKYGL